MVDHLLLQMCHFGHEEVDPLEQMCHSGHEEVDQELVDFFYYEYVV